MRSNGVYEVVRVMHENESVDKISEHIERLVNLLMRDEPSGNADEVEIAATKIEVIDEDDRVEEV